jgi:BRCA1 C Terminus (BRCT) domain
MSWKSKKEKEDFFLSLDKAFNTPSTGTLVIPQIDEFRRAPEPDQHPSPRESKRRRSDNIDRDSKRRCSSSAASLTGVGIRNESPEDPRPVKSTPPSLHRSKSAGSNSKSSGKEIETPRKSNLLDGMVLFFIPNSRKNGVRRFRMTLFAQHGADIRDAWSDEITHIICDQNVNGDKVLQVMRWEQIPVPAFSWIG